MLKNTHSGLLFLWTT